MHDGTFGEREGFTDEASQALAQGVVKTLDLIRGAPVIGGVVLLWGKDVVIAFQVIGMEVARAIGRWEAPPQQAGGGVTARSQGVGHDLAGPAASSQPQPDHPPPTMSDKAPQFIDFQSVFGLGRGQCGLQRGQPQGFFLTSRSPYCGKPQRCASAPADCCAPHRPAESSPARPPSRRWNPDAPDAVDHSPDTDTVACRWV